MEKLQEMIRNWLLRITDADLIISSLRSAVRTAREESSHKTAIIVKYQDLYSAAKQRIQSLENDLDRLNTICGQLKKCNDRIGELDEIINGPKPTVH